MDEPHDRPETESQKPWMYRRAVINGVFWGLLVVCVLLGLADLVYHRHTVFAFEAFPGIYGIFGFISCIFIVFAGIGLRKLIMRDEDYYDD